MILNNHEEIIKKIYNNSSISYLSSIGVNYFESDINKNLSSMN